MRTRRSCGLVALGALFVVVACLVFVALAAAMVLTGEMPLYAPRLTGFQPEPGFAFQPTTPITLSFDQPMQPASVEAAFSLEPAVSGTFEWNEGLSQVTFVPEGAGYQPGASYTVRLEAGIRAATLSRRTANPVEWGFSLPPLVDSLAPPLGEEDLGPGPTLEVSFNYLLDCGATLRTFSTSPQAMGLLACKEYTITFSPTLPLEPGTAYAASLEQVFLQGDSWPRPGVRWEFRTAASLDIVGATPRRAGFVMDLWTPVRITFNRPVVADTVVPRFSLVDGDGESVLGQVIWEEGGSVFVFKPQDPLMPSSIYRFTLVEGVRDELGFELGEGFTRQFSTLNMMGMPLPVPGSKDVPLDSTVRVPFTRPMDRASVEAGVVFSPSLEVDRIWEEDTLILIPRGGLAPETHYEVSVDADVRDESGAPLAVGRHWIFTTQPFLLDAQVPGDATLVELGRPIEFTFALPMDRASVRAALTISPTVDGKLVWSGDDRTVVFQPEPAWSAGTDYQIELSGSARTADGKQTLGEDLAWDLSTGVAEVQFGLGPNVQVIDLAGERALQVVFQGADVADFHLYAITPTQLLDLYSSGFRGIGPDEPQFIDTSVMTPTIAWREHLTWLGSVQYDGWKGAEVHLPADVEAGVYVLTTPTPTENGQLLVVLTRHVLVLKRALAGSGSRTQAQVVAWDTELSGGAPVVSATLRLYDRDGTFLAEGLTDDDGLLTLNVRGDPGPLLALSEKDGDVTVCGLSNEWSEEGWWWWWTQPPSRPLYTTYSYTDRPIYRPGQTVHFKDVVRASDDVSYTLPGPDLPITVRLRDARDNVAATQVLTPTQYGTVFGKFQLADEPMLGTWNLETEVEGAITRQPLKVEAYRKPEYEVSVHTSQRVYAQGETISVTVEAAYYFGQPVAAASVTLAAYPTYPDYYYDGSELRFDPPIFTDDGRTDTQGRWTVLVPTMNLLSSRGESEKAMLALEAIVTDDSGQGVSNYQTVVVQRTSQKLTLLLEKHGYLPSEKISFMAQVRDRSGEPVDGVNLTARILGWDGQEVTGAEATTGEAGQALFSFSLGEQGWYDVRVTGADDGGRDMQTEIYLWIYDPSGLAPWYQGQWRESGALSVSADRSTYAVGDLAQIVISAPQPGPALLTFERGETRHAEPVTLVSGTNLITLSVRADYAPNVQVTVNQFGAPAERWFQEQSRPEAQLHTASAQLLVPMTDRLLTVTLAADRETYAPGDEATFVVRVTDREGKPVVAEVSLAVVDEAIYALAQDMSRDPFEIFYAPQPNIVRTYDSLGPTRWLYPGGPGLGGGDGEGDGGAPRRDFQDTAYWAPAVVTDKDGRASITFELPDNLTEWRALARAVTSDTLVGQATAQIVVSRDIVVRPALPRFLVQSDAITLTAVVNNFTAQPVSATVELELEGLSLAAGKETQVVSVPAAGSAVAGWPVLAVEPGEAQVIVRTTATYGGAKLAGRDAVELPLPVVPLAIPEIVAFAGALTPAQPTATLTFTLPADTIEDLSRLEIDLAPSVAPGLVQGLEYLIGYPYGCVEQTMSRVLPNAMVAQAFRKLGIQSEILEADLPPMVDLGLQKLYGFQHNDGGWGWWYDDSTDVNQTAYVLFGLEMTGQAGFDVDGGVVDRGVAALRNMLPDADPHAQAYGAYVLTMAGLPVSITLTLSDALDLDLFSQAALAIALGAMGDGVSANVLLDNLRESAIQDATTVHWQDEGDQALYNRQVMGSAVRTTAMVADALVRLDPESPLLPRAVLWLMEQRQGQGWGDTQKTSYAILALTDYLLASQELATGVAFQVYVNDQLWQEGQFDRSAASQTLVLTYSQSVSPALLLPGENRVRLVLEQEPTGRLYYASTLNVQRAPQDGQVPALQTHQRSIGILREYRLAVGDESMNQFAIGDLVEVRLTLDVPDGAWYVVVDDPLPAGLEPLNERLGTTSHVASAYEEPIYHWQDYGYNRKEIRDDRVSFFFDYLEPGQHTVTYLARAITAGNMTALPAQAYPMYEPEVWSRSASTRCYIAAR